MITTLEKIMKLERAARKAENASKTETGIDKEYFLMLATAARRQAMKELEGAWRRMEAESQRTEAEANNANAERRAK